MRDCLTRERLNAFVTNVPEMARLGTLVDDEDIHPIPRAEPRAGS